MNKARMWKLLLLALLSSSALAEELIRKDYCFYKRRSWITAYNFTTQVMREQPVTVNRPLALYHKLGPPDDINTPIVELKGQHCFYLKTTSALHERIHQETERLRAKWEKNIVLKDDLERPVKIALAKPNTYAGSGLDVAELKGHTLIEYRPKDGVPFVLKSYQFKMDRAKFDNYVGPMNPEMKELKPLERIYVRAHYVSPGLVRFSIALGSANASATTFYLGENEALELPAVYMTMKNSFPFPVPEMLSGVGEAATVFYSWPTLLVLP